MSKQLLIDLLTFNLSKLIQSKIEASQLSLAVTLPYVKTFWHDKDLCQINFKDLVAKINF